MPAKKKGPKKEEKTPLDPQIEPEAQGRFSSDEAAGPKEPPADQEQAEPPEIEADQGGEGSAGCQVVEGCEGTGVLDDAAADVNEKRLFPVIGVGASAGGLEALEELFQSLPEESGMAFVVVSHTDPDRTSLLPDILQRRIRIPVVQVEDGMHLQPDTVYLPPSNRDLVLDAATFRLKEQRRGSMLRLPIDTFLKSLATSRGEQAGCVILSGTGTDGTQGLRVIKEKGGVTMVQSLDSARYEGMPQSAMATGLADFVLRPSEMLGRIADYFAHDVRLAQPKESECEEEFPATLSKIITTISTRIGHDFNLYKKSTLIRRIQRRMSVTRILTAQKYLSHLHRHPDEIDALFQDLLIGVTSFFRDPEAFAFLRQGILPDLLRRKGEHQAFRVWVPGCASGEEVYSIVILILECLDELNLRRDVQVFGTDIDRVAIDRARDGVYQENIAADVSPQRMKRFFEKESTGYRVRKEVREPVVFAVQNLLKDPPFSRLDLLVCRNLLIYLESRAQKKLLPLFHYALKSGGVLFLGPSETVGDATDLFSSVQKKWNFYRKIDVSPALQPIIEFPTGSRGVAMPPERSKPGAPAIDLDVPAVVAKATERLLLDKHTPTCVVVNQRGEISYIHGRTGKYLEPAPGRMSVNIVDMAREGLRFEIASALRKVAATGETVRKEGLRVKTNGDSHGFNLTLKPLGEPASLKDMIVVLFEEIAVPKKNARPKKTRPSTAEPETERVIELERELARVKQDHRTAMEELETTNEELKSVNEELQSSNEELQSTNEELESSREELQSLNEELSTVNAELHDKIVQLSQAYDTFTHVLNSTRIAILFVDRSLNVLRFTHEATRLINLIDSDVGRPLPHISTNLEYDTLLSDTKEAMQELKTLEREVRSRDGDRYSVRIVPYQDTKGMIDGAILTFINMSGHD